MESTISIAPAEWNEETIENFAALLSHNLVLAFGVWRWLQTKVTQRFTLEQWGEELQRSVAQAEKAKQTLIDMNKELPF